MAAMQIASASIKRALGRRGYLYVAVLFTTLVASTMGLAALSSASLRMRATIDVNDRAVAEALSLTAIEDALFLILSNDQWRKDYAHDIEYSNPDTTIGGGSYTFKLFDDDGNLDDDDSDSVRVIGIGRVGRATAAESARLLPMGKPLSCLESSFHCDADISLNTLIVFTTDQHISSNRNLSASALLASIQGNAQAVGTVTGTISGNKSQGVAVRRMPGSSVFDYYLDNGTFIPITALPIISGAYTIERCLLSPQSNPFGGRNPEGVYVIDCQGQRVRIQNCRIFGTILLLNPAANSSLEGSLRWDAAVGNYPALLVKGDLGVSFAPSDLSEITLLQNFNPAGSPYSGSQDADQLDTYPSEINGVTYISGRLNAPADLVESRFRGSVICGSLTADSNCRFKYRPMLLAAPPPGFSRGNPMELSPGSRRRETLP